MNHRSRYSPTSPIINNDSSSIIRGPSNIYTSTTSVLGGGSYNRENFGSNTSLCSSPRRFQGAPLSLPISVPAMTTSESTVSYTRSSRVSSDSYRARSRSPTFTPTTTTISSTWKPTSSTTSTIWKTPTSSTSANISTTSYSSRSRIPDPESPYSIEKDPIVAAISRRLSREMGSNNRGLKSFDLAEGGNEEEDNYRIPKYHRLEQNIGKSGFFNHEEKRFLASVSKMVNSSDNFEKQYFNERNYYPEENPSIKHDFIQRYSGFSHGSLPRSNSFQDLRDQELIMISPSAPLGPSLAARDRHKTLAYGVSAADLAKVIDPQMTMSKNTTNNSEIPNLKFGMRSGSDYEQSANVTIRGPSSINPLSGFKSDMSSTVEAVSGKKGSENERIIEDKDNLKNGDVDYKKLWEETQDENAKLREDLRKIRTEMKALVKKMETNQQENDESKKCSGLNEREKKEKVVLEKKLAEMEEELRLLALSENLTDQQLEHLKNDNQRLRNENEALIRVISKLSK